MSTRPFRPFRWVAGGSIALIVTIWTALMLGLNAPAVRNVPVAPWAEGGYGADATQQVTAAPPAVSAPQAPVPASRVAGVRIPARAPRAGAANPSTPLGPARAPMPPAAPLVPAPVRPAVPALPVASLPTLAPAVGAWSDLLGVAGA